jgi:hypothetical protein
MPAERPEKPLESPFGQLERALIDEYVRARGYDPHRLADVPQAERDQLLKDASRYASTRLTEVESRSRFLDDIHDARTGE